MFRMFRILATFKTLVMFKILVIFYSLTNMLHKTMFLNKIHYKDKAELVYRQHRNNQQKLLTKKLKIQLILINTEE